MFANLKLPTTIEKWAISTHINEFIYISILSCRFLASVLVIIRNNLTFTTVSVIVLIRCFFLLQVTSWWVAPLPKHPFSGRRRRRRSHLWTRPGVSWRGRCPTRKARRRRRTSWINWTLTTWRGRNIPRRDSHCRQTRKSRYRWRDSLLVTWGRARLRQLHQGGRRRTEEGWRKQESRWRGNYQALHLKRGCLSLCEPEGHKGRKQQSLDEIMRSSIRTQRKTRQFREKEPRIWQESQKGDSKQKPTGETERFKFSKFLMTSLSVTVEADIIMAENETQETKT